MKISLKPLTLCLLGPLLLAGCQQTPVKNVMPEQQIQQLGALVAASDWLREHCDRRDIPAKSTLLASAIKQGEARGWKVSPMTHQQLLASADNRYQAINEDNTPKNEKCATLNSAAAPFIAKLSAN